MSSHFLVTVLVMMVTVLATTSVADTPDCPYPCLPPPISSTINTYPPPPPSTGGIVGSYPPPASAGYLTPPGVMPGYFAPPYGSFPTPPPPNPILPWFPWYYRHDNPITGSSKQASSAALGRTAISNMVVHVLLAVFLAVLVHV